MNSFLGKKKKALYSEFQNGVTLLLVSNRTF